MKYALISKDTKKNINYYYNFKDNLIYASDNKSNKCTLKGIIGIIIGFIIYLSFVFLSYYLPYSNLFIILVGIIFGRIITLIANSTIKNIFKKAGKKISTNKIKELYKNNKLFRLKYFTLLILFLILAILCLILYQNNTNINFLLFTSTIMVSFLFFLYRPINSFKLLKYIKTSL